jgi:flagella basal body P-ring formation protein FlgA
MLRKDCSSLIRALRIPPGRPAFGGIAVLVLAALAGSASAAAVRMWPSSVVDDDQIRVGDVAEILSVVPDQASAFGSVVIRPAPPPGQEVEISLEELREVLTHAGANPAEFTVCGAVRCQVVRPLTLRTTPVESSTPAKGKWWWPGGPRASRGGGSQPDGQTQPGSGQIAVSAGQPAPGCDTLEAALTRYVNEKLSTFGGRVHMRFSPNVKAALSLARPEYDFRINWRSEQRLGQCSLEVDVLQEGKVKQTIPMLVETSLTIPVAVAARPISRGQVIKDCDVQLQECDFFHVDRIGLTEVGMVVGQQSRRFLRPGELIYPRDLRTCPLVNRGDLVTVWSEVNGLKIKTAAKAMESGVYGESVTVRNESSRETFQATVVGPQTVKMSSPAHAVTVASSAEKDGQW